MDREVPKATFLDRWRRDQHFIFSVSRHIENADSDEADQNRIFSYLWPNGPDLPDPASERQYRERLEALPPIALELVCSLKESHVYAWEDHVPIWKDVLGRLKWDTRPKHKVSRLAGAKLLANRISTGWLSPARLCRIAWLEMRADGWEAVPNIERRLSDLTTSFRGVANPYQKLSALAEFRTEKVPSGWAMVENVLLQDLFSWPLLVAGKDAEGEDVSYAMPAIVHVELGTSDCEPAELTSIIGGDHIVADDWQSHLEKARDAAIKLWETKRGANAEHFQKAVREARVALDLRVASDIFQTEFPHGKVELVDGSLGAYVAIEILSRILGQTSGGRLSATGTLTDFVPNGEGKFASDGGDYTIDFVGGVLSKIRCADRSFYFDKIVVPRGVISLIEKSIISKEAFDLEIVEGYDPDNYYSRHIANEGMFGEYARHALGQLWRNHRYVRCPDIEVALKSEKALRGEHHSARQSTVSKKILRDEGPWYDSIIDFADRYTGADIARALYWKLRKAENDSRWSEIPRDKRRGNFAFVRATGDEQNERFWATIWAACGGEAQDFRQFVLSTSAHEAAECVATLLNNLAPTNEHRARAPDVLVIVGANRLIREDEDTLQQSSEGHQFRLSAVLSALSEADSLKSCPNPVLRTQLLRCRIIVVDEAEPGPNPLPTHRLAPELQQSAVGLSVFRRGFSLPVAQSMLGLDREATKALLHRLAQYGTDGLQTLGYSEPTGEYWMNFKPQFTHPETQYALHLKAANALVGILDRTERPDHEDYATSLRPEHLHEAQWHVESAFRLSQPGSAKRDLARSHRERLSRIGEPFTWSQLAWNVNVSYEAGDEIWSEVLEASKAMGVRNLNLTQLLHVAQFAAKLSKRNTARKSYFTSANRKIIAYALGRLASLPAKQSNALRFKILTFKSWMAMRSSPDDDGAAATANDNARAWNCYPIHGGEILYSEWFEQYGDATDVHWEALSRYGRGFLNQSVAGATYLRLTAMVKWLGCLSLTREQATVSQRRAIADALTDQHRATLKVWATVGAPPKSGLHRRPVATRRLDAGMKLISSRGFLDA